MKKKAGSRWRRWSREESAQGQRAFTLLAVFFAPWRLGVRFFPAEDESEVQTEPLPINDGRFALEAQRKDVKSWRANPLQSSSAYGLHLCASSVKLYACLHATSSGPMSAPGGFALLALVSSEFISYTPAALPDGQPDPRVSSARLYSLHSARLFNELPGGFGMTRCISLSKPLRFPPFDGHSV